METSLEEKNTVAFITTLVGGLNNQKDIMPRVVFNLIQRQG